MSDTLHHIARHTACRRLLPFLLAATALLVSCVGGYSFTGASIPIEAKTLSLQPFPNYATTVNPQLSQKLYDALHNLYESQTRLSVTGSDGDLQVSGEITSYTTQASSLSSDDNVATNRLTVTIKVKFVNLVTPADDFEQSFTRYKDYDATRDFSAVENALVEQIVTELSEDVFNKTVVNW
ncbi:MAG: hypothetical protein AUK63_1464 [bacterium P3]|nr:MAG: hypothetical protein AUK63_1464 [bacterium P3]KWW40042.1 MAG: hypothetical protein F083_1764 [bacterium F083]